VIDQSRPAESAGVLSYATPPALDRRGPWREGRFVVKPSGVSLPNRCVRCNEPAREAVYDVQNYYATFRFVQYRNIQVPLCRTHAVERRRRRRAATLTGVSGAVTLFLPLVLGGAQPFPAYWFWWIAIPLLCLSQFLTWRSIPLRLRRVVHDRLYLGGAGEAFLASLDSKTEGATEE